MPLDLVGDVTSMNLKQIVPNIVVLTTALILTGCDNSGQTGTTVKPASNQQPQASPAAPAAAEDATAAKLSETDDPSKPVLGPDGKPIAYNLSSSADRPLMVPAGPSNAKLDNVTDPAIQPPQPPRPASDPSAPVLVTAEPSVLDFGEIPTADSKTASLKLVNTGDKPMTINSARASCGCTALKVVPGTILQPGESTEVEVRLSAPTVAGKIQHKNVTFVIEGQPEIVVPLTGNAVSYVVIEPTIIEAEKMPDGQIVVKSIDDQAFRITGVQPQVIEGLPTEAAVEHHLAIDFSKYRELGISRKTVLYVDHPKCQQIYANVTFSQADYAAEAERRKSEQANLPGKDVQHEIAAPVQTEDMQIAEMIRSGRNAEVMAKISEGLKVDHRDPQGQTLLAIAAKHGNVELISALLAAAADKEGADNIGKTPLMNAAQAKSSAAVRALLDAGASVTVRDSTPVAQTALHYAAGTKDNAEVVQELIDAGAEVDAVCNVVGWTPLIWASGFGDPNAIPILVKAGANLEVADFLQGATPLINAARTGEIEAIEALIKAGANLEATDNTGKTALLAAAEGSGGTADKVQALIDAGASLNAKDSRGLNALELARKRTDPRSGNVIIVLEKYLGETTPESPGSEESPGN
jgi:ankyrin repeat protein